jgi:hypothetical protein
MTFSFGEEQEKVQRYYILKNDYINYRYKKYESCRQKFKENRILTVTSQYVFNVLCFGKKVEAEFEAKLCDP